MAAHGMRKKSCFFFNDSMVFSILIVFFLFSFRSVLVYPNGKEGDNYLSASLLVSNFQDLPPGWWITTNFSLCIETNSQYRRRVLAASEKCFDANNPSWGKIYWLHRRELNGFLVNGDLKIVAQVEVLNKSTHEEIDLDYEHC